MVEKFLKPLNFREIPEFLKLRGGYLRLNMCPRWTKPRSNLEGGTDTVPHPNNTLSGKEYRTPLTSSPILILTTIPQILNEPIRKYFTLCGQILLYNHYQGTSKRNGSLDGVESKLNTKNRTKHQNSFFMFSLHCRLSKAKFYFLKKRLTLLQGVLSRNCICRDLRAFSGVTFPSKHTLFCRETAFVAIYALFQG